MPSGIQDLYCEFIEIEQKLVRIIQVRWIDIICHQASWKGSHKSFRVKIFKINFSAASITSSLEICI